MENMGIRSYAVIAAAGSGSRMGGVSKPNIRLLGKTLFEYVLGAFDSTFVDGIVVVCSEDNIQSLKELSVGFKKPVSFVLGGSTRGISVYNGIACAQEKGAEIVCVHDCARPFITAEIIENAIKAAAEKGASCVCSPITDTVKMIDQGGNIVTPDRSRMFAVQTPQCFKISLYHNSRKKCNSPENLTDETALLELGGYSVEYIKTTENNMKLTSKSDVPLAEAIMKSKGENNA